MKQDTDVQGKWTVNEAVDVIRRNGGTVNTSDKSVSHYNPGIKVLGAIDFLVNHRNYVRRK